MNALVRGGDVTDTTSDPRWSPVTVTAHLAEPVVGVADPMHLDGPLSWAAFLAAKAHDIVLPALGDGPPVDFALPLATWTAPAPPGADPSILTATGDVWGWACSRAIWAPVAWTAAHTRKAPAVTEMARYGTDRRYHAALGPHKARNALHQAAVADRITWHALAEPDHLTELLTRLHGLGRLTRHGWGRIHRITVTPSADRDAWRDRDMPDPDGIPGGIRAPYWHPTRHITCSSTRPA